MLTLVILVGALPPDSARAASTSPLSPAEESAGFQLADPELRVELVAAEPLVTSPVAIAWDAAGRLFVAEMNDYPTAKEGGRVRVLEDRDGDGRFETSRVFADGLHFPASVLPWRDGVLVAAAPEVRFFRDAPGEGPPPAAERWLYGFGEGNQQLRVNGLAWGLDNWIYGANGRSDGELRALGTAAPISLRRHDFRFRPGSGFVACEALAGPSQFGLALDEAGNRFLSWNTVPIRHELIPLRHFDRAPVTLAAESLVDCLDSADDKRVYPKAPVPQTFNRESTSHFNALAGLHVYGGDALGPGYVGSAFMGETLRSLIHRRVLEPVGPTFVARRAPAEAKREFLAATDPWCHPVYFATGPDGALYFCDFYRRWVEHPAFVPAHLRGSVDWREGWEHGRIWRITRADRTAANGSGSASAPSARLDRSTVEERVAALAHPNSWRRLTAQRLLVERRETAAVPALRRLLETTRADAALGRLHALWTLDGLEAIEVGDLLRSTKDNDPRVRRAALKLAAPRWVEASRAGAGEPSRFDERLVDAVLRLATDTDAAVRFELALQARGLRSPRREQALVSLLERDGRDPWWVRAALGSCDDDARPLLRSLLESSAARRDGSVLLFEIGRQIAASNVGADLGGRLAEALLPWVTRESRAAVEILAGMADGLARTGRDSRSVVGLATAPFGGVVAESWKVLDGGDVPIGVRVRAMNLIFATTSPDQVASLRRFLRPSIPAELQWAAIEGLSASADRGEAAELFAKAGELTSPTRRRMLAVAVRRAPTTEALLDAVEHGSVARVEIDPAARDQLLRHADAGIRARADGLFRNADAADRAAVIERYRPALAQRGDFARGAQVFSRNCVVCHRIGNTGGQVGPELSGIGARAPEVLITDILDPSRQVAPDFAAYTIEVRGAEPLTGLLVQETGAGVTLRRANLPDETLPRERVQAIRADGRSLMPDGLETGFSVSEFADLLAFLAAPDAEALAPVGGEIQGSAGTAPRP